METEVVIMTALFGSGGLAVLVSTIMHQIKKRWKPEDKNLYKIPSGIMSLLAGYGVMSQLELSVTVLLWIVLYLLISAFVMAFQLFGENEAWDDIKKIFLMLLRVILKKG